MKKFKLQTMVRFGTFMHLYLIFLLAIITLSSILGQAPANFNYQAVLRNGAGEIKTNMDVSVQISIIKGEPSGTNVFTEIHNTTTNKFGLINIKVGSLETSSFAAIDWANGPYFIKLEVDGAEMGTSQLLSVPYALYADEAGNGFSGNYNDLSNKPDLSDFLAAESDPVFNSSQAKNITDVGSGAVITVAERTKLIGVQTGAEVNVNVDWNAVSGDAKILNKPDMSGFLTTEIDPTWDGSNNTIGSISRTGNIGIGITSPAALLHAYGIDTGEGNVLLAGLYKSSSPGNPPASGAGTRMMWYPDKAAFRAGHIEGVNWNKDSIGNASVAMGYNTKAKGNYSIALGYFSYAWGIHSTAIGTITNATGDNSTALGYSSKAKGDYSTALGRETKAVGNTSTALGYATNATGSSSTSMGNSTIASGTASTAMGYWSSATGLHSGAMGSNVSASGDYSTAFGRGSSASGENSITTGYGSSATGYTSTAMGRGAKATSDYSFAIHLNFTAAPEVGANTFYVSGASNIGGNRAWENWSDLRLKKDIHKLSTENNLAKIMQLNGIRFRWKDNDTRLNLGFIAQQVKDIVPESIHYDELNDIYSMEYTAIIPVLVEGIKEQQKTIETLKTEIQSLQQQINELR